MSEPLTLDQLTAALAATEQRLIEKIEEATEPHFTALKIDLTRMEKKLDNVLAILHDGDRIDELERRVRKLAELAGVPEFTQPIRRPLSA